MPNPEARILPIRPEMVVILKDTGMNEFDTNLLKSIRVCACSIFNQDMKVTTREGWHQFYARQR